MIEVFICDNITLPTCDTDEMMRIVTDTAEIALKLFDKNASATIMLTDNDSIREINREYRGIDSATDVLSFPALEAVDDSDPVCDAFIGDIAISLERALEQSEVYGHSFMREIAFLTAHGMLHLLGYDHMTTEDEAVMIDLQKQIMTEMRLTR